MMQPCLVVHLDGRDSSFSGEKHGKTVSKNSPKISNELNFWAAIHSGTANINFWVIKVNSS